MLSEENRKLQYVDVKNQQELEIVDKTDDEVREMEDLAALIAFWTFDDDIGFRCTSSFQISAPVPVKLNENEKRDSWLYTGLNNEVYWFSMTMKGNL